MPTSTFSLPLTPQGCTYSIPSSDPQVSSSTATSSSAHLSHRSTLGIRANHPASQTGLGASSRTFFFLILFFSFVQQNILFNVSFD